MLRQAFQAKDSNFSIIGQFLLPVQNQTNLSKKIANIHKPIRGRQN